MEYGKKIISDAVFLDGIPPLRNLETRSRILCAIREFFARHNFLETDTPLRIPAPALETHIDAIPAGDRAWLRTSPELHMKRLLAAGYNRIYQLGPCFRAHEKGRRHNPEFTMLEWYRTNADYLDILDDCERLIEFVVNAINGKKRFDFHGKSIDVTPPWTRLTVSETYIRFAGWDPCVNFDPDRFDLDMVNLVEPSLPQEKPCVLIDYPVQAAALARLKSGNKRVAERWEVYIGGLEIANAYSELIDAVEQRKRFEAAALERANDGRDVYPMDERFMQALEQGLPDCGGIALGVDRLIMLLCDTMHISDVRVDADG